MIAVNSAPIAQRFGNMEENPYRSPPPIPESEGAKRAWQFCLRAGIGAGVWFAVVSSIVYVFSGRLDIAGIAGAFAALFIVFGWLWVEPH